MFNFVLHIETDNRLADNVDAVKSQHASSDDCTDIDDAANECQEVTEQLRINAYTTIYS